ncbi:MAG TPA: ABC transporter ATP-binding protein [Sedimenticola thiotaurini]|uniref:ABC transporter ATP-binding protein n=1 Tax=Sedimenticola thiotaurini TaxID=1543721 RepID=A0A831RJ98_9GAMM|nr:ABC transporter ATP-binding protein [Sedimenticola thiotaurini]
MLQARGLSKRYPGVEAVKGIDLALEQGVCLGLLGPNGAGKTTTVEMLEGIVTPSGGTILYRGKATGPGFRQEAGIMFQQTSLQDYIRVEEALRLFASFYRRTRPLEELIRRCALEEFLRRDVRHLSGGQRQRLLLAIALVNDPEILFLDEPTTGLDPQSRRNFWDLIDSIKGEGKTVLLTTHYMEEAHALCDRVAIMDHGRIVTAGTPRELLRRHFDSAVITLPQQQLPPSLADRLPFPVHRVEGQAEILSDDLDRDLRLLLDHGVSLHHLQVRSRTLEDLFLELTGRQLRG